MQFIPVQRHIQICEDRKSEEQSMVLLPVDYIKKEEPYKLVSVISVADDVRFSVKPGDKIIVDSSMIKQIKTDIFGDISIICDNYVMGIITQ